jgi:Tfp pilus assembly protein PilE
MNADQTGAKAPTYKMFCRRFDEGTAEQFILLLHNLDVLWTQNSLDTAADRLANLRAILRNESLTQFEASLEEQKQPTTARGATKELTNDMITKGLEEVAKSVFPYRALEIQKNWMRRIMKKPVNMTFRVMNTAVNRMNNALKHFPGATATSAFTEEQLVEILQWTIPARWVSKFDLDGYIITEHSRAKLVAQCEAMERFEAANPPIIKSTTNTKFKKSHNKARSSGQAGFGKASAVKAFSFNCSHHGANATHDSKDCFVLKKRTDAAKDGGSKPAAFQSANRTFSKKSFRKEVNSLSVSTGGDKRKVLDLFAATIREERKRLGKSQKAMAKKAQASDASSNESDDDSIHVLEVIPAPITDKRKTPEHYVPPSKRIKCSHLANPERTAALIALAREKAKEQKAAKEAMEIPKEAPTIQISKLAIKKVSKPTTNITKLKAKMANLGKSPSDDEEGETEMSDFNIN